MDNVMVWDADDFGATHQINPVCWSRDCRGQLDKFHYANPAFRATLFAIPGEMTKELADWCESNKSWIELAVHGLFHSDNYECNDITAEDFDERIKQFQPMLDRYFTKGFRAPGWQISDGIYQWLLTNGWWVADQSYNDGRRPKELPAYINKNGEFSYSTGQPTMINKHLFKGKHYHTWDVGAVGNEPNGVYEAEQEILDSIQGVERFMLISELFA